MAIQLKAHKSAPDGIWYLVDYQDQHDRLEEAERLEELVEKSGSLKLIAETKVKIEEIYDALSKGFMVKIRPQNYGQIMAARKTSKAFRLNFNIKGKRGVVETDIQGVEAAFKEEIILANVLDVRGVVDIDNKPITDWGEAYKLLNSMGKEEALALADVYEAITEATHLEAASGEAFASRSGS